MREIISHNTKKWKNRLLIATPTEGWVRYEWAHARYAQVIPMNWEAGGFAIAYTTIGYNIDDAYNAICKHAIDKDVDWLITIEDDVILPPDCFSKFYAYQDKGDIPVVSGLYYLKASPTLPLIFRGRGTSAYTGFKVGDKVWCDGLPMGCLMIHMSLVKWMWEHTEEYTAIDGAKLRRVFHTPRKCFLDPEVGGYNTQNGTQDLFFFDRLIENDVFAKCGWKKIAKKEYPLLCDTSIFCRHIDRNSGRQYP